MTRAGYALLLALSLVPVLLAKAPVVVMEGAVVTPMGLSCDCLYLDAVERFRASYVPLLLSSTALLAYTAIALLGMVQASPDHVLVLLVALLASSINMAANIPALPPVIEDSVGAFKVIVHVGAADCTLACTVLKLYPVPVAFATAFTAVHIYLSRE